MKALAIVEWREREAMPAVPVPGGRGAYSRRERLGACCTAWTEPPRPGGGAAAREAPDIQIHSMIIW